jgi:hypothetical protein
MNKDVIYIDVEDDITAIIGKVKNAKSKIVALVPPKRIGVLQSAVNLRLLDRAASQGNKHLVLISSNSALVALAAAAKIPVAKNLQSKPEIAEVAASDGDGDEDIIDGNSLPVGDLARTADGGAASLMSSPAINAAVRENAAEELPMRAVPPTAAQQLKKPKVKSGIRVPNFDKFRKKLILISGGGVLLLIFLVWAIFFAPRATVVIAARTSDASVNARVNLDPAAATSLQGGALKLATKQIKKDQAVDFTATGKKEVGEKATGSMKLTRTSPSGTPMNVPAGTQFTASGLTFVSTQDATLTSQLTPNGFDPGSATVPVQATAIGGNYNLSARSYQSNMSGFTANGTDMAGGSSRTVTVVSSDDIKKAADQFASQNSDAIKKELSAQFDSSVIVIAETFKTDQSTPVSAPALDQEAADGKAKLTSSVTYSLSAVAKTDATKYLDEYFTAQLANKDDQRIYDNGASKTSFANISDSGNGVFAANIVANAKIGPKIDDQEVKTTAAGKRYGDIQSSLESIQGVESVDVKYWPFWVTAAPNDTKRISVEFKLNESN